MEPRHIGPNAVARFEENRQGRDFVCGDVHGDFETLEHLLAEVRFEQGTDRLFGLGDLIDRGPQSDQAMAWVTEGRMTATVRGNHEQTLLESLERAIDDGSAHAGEPRHDWFVDTVPKRLWAEWRRWLETLPIAATVETGRGPVGLVHACVTHSDWTKTLDAIGAGDLATAYDALWRPAGVHLGEAPAARPDLAHAHRAGEPMHALMTGHTILAQAQPNPEAPALWHLDTGGGEADGAITMAEINADPITTTTAGVRRGGRSHGDTQSGRSARWWKGIGTGLWDI